MELSIALTGGDHGILTPNFDPSSLVSLFYVEKTTSKEYFFSNSRHYKIPLKENIQFRLVLCHNDELIPIQITQLEDGSISKFTANFQRYGFRAKFIIMCHDDSSTNPLVSYSRSVYDEAVFLQAIVFDVTANPLDFYDLFRDFLKDKSETKQLLLLHFLCDAGFTRHFRLPILQDFYQKLIDDKLVDELMPFIRRSQCFFNPIANFSCSEALKQAILTDDPDAFDANFEEGVVFTIHNQKLYDAFSTAAIFRSKRIIIRHFSKVSSPLSLISFTKTELEEMNLKLDYVGILLIQSLLCRDFELITPSLLKDFWSLVDRNNIIIPRNILKRCENVSSHYFPTFFSQYSCYSIGKLEQTADYQKLAELCDLIYSEDPRIDLALNIIDDLNDQSCDSEVIFRTFAAASSKRPQRFHRIFSIFLELILSSRINLLRKDKMESLSRTYPLFFSFLLKKGIRFTISQQFNRVSLVLFTPYTKFQIAPDADQMLLEAFGFTGAQLMANNYELAVAIADPGWVRKFGKSIFEDDLNTMVPLVNDVDEEVFVLILGRSLNIISLASYYGAFRCFMLLEMNGALVNEATLEYSIAGGNVSIIKVIDGRVPIASTLGMALKSAVYYRRLEIIEFLFEMFEMTNKDIIHGCTKLFDYQFLGEEHVMMLCCTGNSLTNRILSEEQRVMRPIVLGFLAKMWSNEFRDLVLE